MQSVRLSRRDGLIRVGVRHNTGNHYSDTCIYEIIIGLKQFICMPF